MVLIIFKEGLFQVMAITCDTQEQLRVFDFFTGLSQLEQEIV